MTRAGLALAALLAAGAGAGSAQTAQPVPQDGAIQMQPLNALKPQTQVAPVPVQPDAADPMQLPGLNQQQQPLDGSAAQPAPAAPAVPGTVTTTTTTTEVADASGAVVRWLDKISGDIVDLTLAKGESKSEGRLTVTLGDCRYPKDDPASNAYAYLTIRDSLVSKPIFAGWMIASSPALDPLDSARYDVWVLHCTTS